MDEFERFYDCKRVFKMPHSIENPHDSEMRSALRFLDAKDVTVAETHR